MLSIYMVTALGSILQWLQPTCSIVLVATGFLERSENACGAHATFLITGSTAPVPGFCSQPLAAERWACKAQKSKQRTDFCGDLNNEYLNNWLLEVRYSGNLNSELVQYSNGPKQFARQMVRYSSNDLNSKFRLSGVPTRASPSRQISKLCNLSRVDPD